MRLLLLLSILFSTVGFHAQNNDTETKKPSVGIMDKRGVDLKEVDVIAGAASTGKHILIYYMGKDPELWQKVQLAASEAKDSGLPVRGMILADPDMTFKNGKDSFFIMVGGLSALKKQVAADEYGSYAIKRLIELVAKENKNRLSLKSAND